jgi:hypothetical protein
MAYGDARATEVLAFPSESYETVIRFQLPEGPHKPLRLRFQAQAAGRLEVNIYDDNPLLEMPGSPLRTLGCDLGKDDLSDGNDGRWVVADLLDVKPLSGIVWVGLHMTSGKPAIWESSVPSGQSFMRDTSPQNPMGLIPSRRTPMLRLEVAP